MKYVSRLPLGNLRSPLVAQGNLTHLPLKIEPTFGEIDHLISGRNTKDERATNKNTAVDQISDRSRQAAVDQSTFQREWPLQISVADENAGRSVQRAGGSSAPLGQPSPEERIPTLIVR